MKWFKGKTSANYYGIKNNMGYKFLYSYLANGEETYVVLDEDGVEHDIPTKEFNSFTEEFYREEK